MCEGRNVELVRVLQPVHFAIDEGERFGDQLALRLIGISPCQLEEPLGFPLAGSFPPTR